MKGIVFTKFFSFVEAQHSIEFLQEVIDQSAIESKGVYASTGTYPACEMAALVGAVSEKTGVDASDLLRAFGEHLFTHFVEGFPVFFERVDNAFEFLASIEDHIHVEVKKLYPDAELPSFEVGEHTPSGFRLIYTSSRHLGDFCEGLIRGCLAHFSEEATIIRNVVSSHPRSVIEFTIERAAS